LTLPAIRGIINIKQEGISPFKTEVDLYMKISRTIGTIFAAATILLAVTGAVTYLLYRISREKAYNEKWEDYIDCGVA
jgi:hypothetical protein